MRFPQSSRLLLAVASMTVLLGTPKRVSTQIIIPDPGAQETTIRVLFVYDPFLVTSNQITAVLNSVVGAWNTTGLPASTGLTITVANNGDPMVLAGSFPPDIDLAFDELEEFVGPPLSGNVRSIRDQTGADLVIGIAAKLTLPGTSSLLCGEARQPNWVKTRNVAITPSNYSDISDGFLDGLDRTGSECTSSGHSGLQVA